MLLRCRVMTHRMTLKRILQRPCQELLRQIVLNLPIALKTLSLILSSTLIKIQSSRPIILTLPNTIGLLAIIISPIIIIKVILTWNIRRILKHRLSLCDLLNLIIQIILLLWIIVIWFIQLSVSLLRKYWLLLLILLCLSRVLLRLLLFLHCLTFIFLFIVFTVAIFSLNVGVLVCNVIRLFIFIWFDRILIVNVLLLLVYVFLCFEILLK
jgi:hypothetical protein